MSPNLSSPLYHLDLRVRGEFERLLKTAPPRPLKRHHLNKLIAQEDSALSQREIDSRILQFYQMPFERRSEQQAARLFRVRPYPWLMQQFLLNFANAAVSDTEMVKAAGRFRHHFRNVLTPPEAVVSVQLLHLTIYRTAHPRADQAKAGINLRIFVRRWRATSFACFGDKYARFFDELEMKLGKQAPDTTPTQDKTPRPSAATSVMNLTQTDLDWMKEILVAQSAAEQPPLIPYREARDQNLQNALSNWCGRFITGIRSGLDRLN